MESKIKHLEMIQGVINRMGNNSFLLKGWSVILISALFALAAKDLNICFILVAYFPALAFWFLDGYFLWQEKLFRELYEKVRKMNETDTDFSMDTSDLLDRVESWSRVAFSRTLCLFHAAVIATILVVMVMALLLTH